MKRFLFIFLMIPFWGFTQESISDSKGIEIGLNVTSVISSFTGNGNFGPQEDFPIMIRFGKSKPKLRIALGFSGGKNEFFDDITGVIRGSTSQKYHGKIGYEKSMTLDKKWNFYWGLDFVTSLKNESVNINGVPDSFIKSNEIGFGGGPFLGLRYNLSERFYLSTEGSFYAIYSIRTVKDDFVFNDISTNDWELNLLPPLFLFLNFSF